MTDMARISSLLCLMSRNFEKWESHYICMLIVMHLAPPFGRNELNNTFEPPLGRQPIEGPPSIKQLVIKVPK